MKHMFNSLTVTTMIFVIGSLSLSACHKGFMQSDKMFAKEETRESADNTFTVPTIRKDGARAWAQNCMRCHNVRDPQERSDREWEIIVHHMRVRANLTAVEHRLIVEFLKAAN